MLLLNHFLIFEPINVPNSSDIVPSFDPKSSCLKQQILKKVIKGFIILQNLNPRLFVIIFFPGIFSNIFALTEDLLDIFQKSFKFICLLNHQTEYFPEFCLLLKIIDKLLVTVSFATIPSKIR